MEFIPISVYDDYVSAHIAMGRLEEDGINCWLKDENTVTLGPFLSNSVGGIKLMVAASQAERAAGILKEMARQYKTTISCPKCGSHNVELVTTPRKATNWIMAALGFLFSNYALPAEKVNHCFDCGNEFPPSPDQW